MRSYQQLYFRRTAAIIVSVSLLIEINLNYFSFISAIDHHGKERLVLLWRDNERRKRQVNHYVAYNDPHTPAGPIEMGKVEALEGDRVQKHIGAGVYVSNQVTPGHCLISRGPDQGPVIYKEISLGLLEGSVVAISPFILDGVPPTVREVMKVQKEGNAGAVDAGSDESKEVTRDTSQPSDRRRRKTKTMEVKRMEDKN